jgi:peptidoglycan/LPS O-acetylase OafA/YrhL
VKSEALTPEPLIRRFMPELDTLRGIAVLGVLFYHGFQSAYGYGRLRYTGAASDFLFATQFGVFGVNLFFVLSGFLITGILLDSKSSPDYYRRFYTRRALRILPAYYLLLILLGLLGQTSKAFLGLSFIYLSNVTDFFGVSMDYGPLWTLAVEEHYYILWPTVVRKLRVRHLAIFSLAICTLIPIARAISFHYGYTTGLDWYTWFVADGLAEGSLLALLLRTSISRKQVAAGSASLLALVPAVLIAGAPLGILTRQKLLGAALQLTLVNTFFVGLLLLFFLLGTGSRKRFVNSSILQFFGYISYALYLVHIMVFRIYDKITRIFWPLLQPSEGHLGLIVLRFVVVGGTAVGLSYISRRYYEEWFLRRKDRLASRPEEETMKVAVAASPGPAPAREPSESFQP